jgi:hypothetical protein
MPITHKIDHGRRLVWANGHGTLTDDEVFAYKRTVWSRTDVAGYDELFDVTSVEHIALPSTARVRELAELAAAMDRGTSASKLAVVAPDDLAFGLARMYEIYRGLAAGSVRQVGIFRSLSEALTFLGMETDLCEPGEA